MANPSVRHRITRIAIGVVLGTALVAPGTAAAAEADPGLAVHVQAKQTPFGKQLEFVGTAADDRFYLLGETDSESWRLIAGSSTTFVIEASAASVCQIHDRSASGNEDETLCRLSELLPRTAAIPQVVAELGGGEDFIRGSAFTLRADGGPGNDRFEAPNYGNTLIGGEGHDELFGGEGDDTISGGPGHDLILGRTGDDVLDGGPGPDRLDGGTGKDQLTGGDGDDLLWSNVEWNEVRAWVPDVDRPASCGPGDDSLVRSNDADQPLVPGASCEHDLLDPTFSTITIDGPMVAGSTLSAGRPARATPPTWTGYTWEVCDGSADPFTETYVRCAVRSLCPTLRLEERDVGRPVRLRISEGWVLGIGWWAARFNPEVRWSTNEVRAAGSAPERAAMGGHAETSDLGFSVSDVGRGWRDGAQAPEYPAMLAYPGNGGTSYEPEIAVQRDCPTVSGPEAPAAVASPAPSTPSPTTTLAPSTGPAEPDPDREPAEAVALPSAPVAGTAADIRQGGTSAMPATAAGPPTLAPFASTSITSAAPSVAGLRGRALVLARRVATTFVRGGDRALRNGVTAPFSLPTGRATVRLEIRSGATWRAVASARVAAGARTVRLAPSPRSRGRLGGAPRLRVVVVLADRGIKTTAAARVSTRR